MESSYLADSDAVKNLSETITQKVASAGLFARAKLRFYGQK